MPKTVGIIAEDTSDKESINALINLISKKKVGCKHFIGKGCGKIAKKSHAWAKQLALKGCHSLILVHDSDTNIQTEVKKLHKSIEESLAPCPFKVYLISLPVQEIESWLLSDGKAIKKALNLSKEPKIRGLIENIESPKEYLGDLIYRTSNKKKQYLNTVHNLKIVENLSISKILIKCPSFKPFYEFVKTNI